ncbi:MAG: aspartate dehydrogenase domain-containing protein, partial [Candidatus Omnitrophota bacterium]
EARKKNIRIFLPSGAICGIDGIKAAKIDGIEKVVLTTTKAPRSLEGAPYLIENGIDVHAIEDKTVIYDGDAEGAIKGFPKNINVASLLSLVGIGAKRTKVKIIAVPGMSNNTHEIEVSGKFGKIFTRTKNVPSEDNPKTSKLAFLSAIALLEGMVDSVKFGT